MLIRMLSEGVQIELEAALPQPLTPTETIILRAIVVVHNPASERIGSGVEIELIESFLDVLNGLIIDTALNGMAEAAAPKASTSQTRGATDTD